MPELTVAAAGRLAAATVLLGGAIWTHANPSDAVLAAYRTEPELAPFRVEFVPALTEALQTVVSGLLARAS